MKHKWTLRIFIRCPIFYMSFCKFFAFLCTRPRVTCQRYSRLFKSGPCTRCFPCNFTYIKYEFFIAISKVIFDFGIAIDLITCFALFHVVLTVHIFVIAHYYFSICNIYFLSSFCLPSFTVLVGTGDIKLVKIWTGLVFILFINAIRLYLRHRCHLFLCFYVIYLVYFFYSCEYFRRYWCSA